jgi:hypothetical protein
VSPTWRSAPLLQGGCSIAPRRHGHGLLRCAGGASPGRYIVVGRAAGTTSSMSLGGARERSWDVSPTQARRPRDPGRPQWPGASPGLSRVEFRSGPHDTGSHTNQSRLTVPRVVQVGRVAAVALEVRVYAGRPSLGVARGRTARRRGQGAMVLAPAQASPRADAGRGDPDEQAERRGPMLQTQDVAVQ